MDFSTIEQLKQELDAKRPLSPETVKSIHDDLIVRWTYNSNAIEGNTLTIYETKVVLEEGVTIGGKKLREHFEAINHREAILYIEDVVTKKMVFSEHILKSIHQLILTNIDKGNAGVYRSANVLISGASHTPPDYTQLQSQMDDLFQWYETCELHPIEKATLLHAKFVNIHPFIDGNGRTARLLLNFELMKYGYPPIIIKADERQNYYSVLDQSATDENFEPFIKMVANYLEERLRFILSLV